MGPWLSWAIALVVGGLVFLYYNSQQKPQVNKTRASSISEAIPPALKPARKRDEVKPKSKAQARPGANSGSSDVKPRIPDATKKQRSDKKQQTPSSAAIPVAARSGPSVYIEQAEEEDNKEWAQQLLSLKKGTTLAAPSRTDSRNKTVKQSVASLTPNFSSASSNAADADDDWTPVRSPAVVAGDVSDMLEPTSSGPSVLRLTEPTNPTKPKQQRQAPLETAETKKQRQNRKKVEERRIQREADEKERQVLLEKQRRTARETRGEPARNGISASKPPTANEWAVQAAIRATQPPSVVVGGEEGNGTGLLDTFERPRQAENSLPSEEDQMLMAKKLSEDESGWNTVPKGKKQKKTKTTSVSDEFSGTDAPGELTAAYAQEPTPVRAPVTKSAEPKSNGYSVQNSFVIDAGSHPDDSAWSA